MFDIASHPSLFWFTGSIMVLFALAVSRMFSPRGNDPYVVWSREYWEDGFYILVAWPGTLMLIAYGLIKRKPFRYWNI